MEQVFLILQYNFINGYPNLQTPCHKVQNTAESPLTPFPWNISISYENITALGSKGLPVLGSIPFFSILTAAKILLASSNPTFFLAIILLIAALSVSSSPARSSPFRIFSSKSKFELLKPASMSSAKEVGRKGGRGRYAVDRVKNEFMYSLSGSRCSHTLREK